jgi:hypothetical protein
MQFLLNDVRQQKVGLFLIAEEETNVHNNKKLANLGSAGRAPSLRVIPWHLPYN